MLVRDANDRDFPVILALNRESESLLSPMDAARLRELHAAAAYHRVAEIDGAIAAFLLAFREGADYDSPNYRWFAPRYDRFLYVDRVAVSNAHRGRGLGGLLYGDLFEFARAAGVPRIVCEYYSVPLNETSQRFHARHGFAEVGSQWLPERGKQVSYVLAST
jgi:predicted GNAT superfamily acetyltransferase